MNRFMRVSTLLLVIPACASSPSFDERVVIDYTGDMIPVQYAAPEYPEQARQSRAEGWVLVEFLVNERGGTEDIRVLHSEPAGVFDQAARQAAAHLKYIPETRNGQLVAVSGVQYRYVFDWQKRPHE